jgi:hypothetical protein
MYKQSAAGRLISVAQFSAELASREILEEEPEKEKKGDDEIREERRSVAERERHDVGA